MKKIREQIENLIQNSNNLKVSLGETCSRREIGYRDYIQIETSNHVISLTLDNFRVDKKISTIHQLKYKSSFRWKIELRKLIKKT